MTRKNKELLIKDLYARLPYGVMAKFGDSNPTKITNITQCIYSNSWFVESEGEYDGEYDGMSCQIDNVKPYLFPLSSMTDELWDKEFMGCGITEFTRDSFKYGCETLEFNNSNPDLSSMVRFINQLIKNHFDIYGLIPMGLAIDATGLNIY